MRRHTAAAISFLRDAAQWICRPTGALIVYTGLAFVLARPVLADFTTSIPHDLGDPLLNLRVLWWNATEMPLTAEWWNAPFFFPHQGMLALSESLLGIAWFTGLARWIFRLEPAALYNTAFLVSFISAAWACYFVCREVTGRDDAAMVGGVAFGFAPYRIAHLAHLQVLWAFWLPLLWLAMMRYVKTGRWSWLALLALSWIGLATTNAYFLLFTPVMIGLWLLWHVRQHPLRFRVLSIAATLVATSVAIYPLLAQYRRVHASFGFNRSIGEIESFSADATSLLNGSELLWLWRLRAPIETGETELYPGVVAAALLAVGAWHWWRRQRAPVMSVWSWALGGVGAVLFAVGIAAWWVGGIAISIGPLTLSITRAYKPLGLGCLLFCVAALSSRGFARSLKSSSSTGWLVLAATASFIFALGPTARVLGYRFWYKAPYSWLMSLPGFETLRVPARWQLLLSFFVAVLVGIAYARISRPRREAFAVGLMALLFLDGFSAVRVSAAPDVYQVAGGPKVASAVLEIPAGELERDTAAMYRSIWHGLPTVNGYSGYVPPFYPILLGALKAGDEEALRTLTEYGPLAVVTDTSTPLGEDWNRRLRTAGVRQGTPTGHWTIHYLPERPRDDPQARSPASGTLRLQSARWNADGIDVAPQLGDGDFLWPVSSGRRDQTGDEVLTVTLMDASPINGVVLYQGPHTPSYPRRLRVTAIKPSGGTMTVWEGSMGARALKGALTDVQKVPLVISFPSVAATKIELRQLDRADQPWTIVELEVTESQPAEPNPATTRSSS